MAEPSILQPENVHSSHPDPEPNVLENEIDRDRKETLLDQTKNDRTESDENSSTRIATTGGDGTKETSRDRALVVVLNEIAHEAHSIGTAAGAAILLVQAGVPVCIASSGSTALEVSDYLTQSSAFRADAPQLCQDVQRDSRFDKRTGKRLGLRSFIAMPIRDRNKAAVAIIEVFSSQPDAFDHRDLFLLKCLGQRIADHIDFANQAPALKKEVADSSQPPVMPSRATISRRPPSFSRWQMPFVGNIWDLLLGASIIFLAILLGWALGRPERDSARRSATDLPAAAARKVEVAHSLSKNDDLGPGSDHLAQTANSSATGSKLNSEKLNSLSDDVAPKNTTNTNHPLLKSTRKAQPDALVIFERGKQIFPEESSAPVSDRQDHADGMEEQSTSQSADRTSAVAVSEEVAEEHLLTRIEPDYPESARQQRLQGTVVLEVRVNTRGVVNGLSQVSGDPQLSLLAAKAVRQWKFLPLVRNGAPVSFESQITVSFALP